jgi:hypothetical protein
MKGQAAEIELGRYYSPRAGFMAGRRQRLIRAGIIPSGWFYGRQAAEIEPGRYYSPRAGFMAGRRQRLSRAGIIPLGLVL